MRIYLVRHGQTYSNTEHLFDTRLPGAELTPTGREQAAAVGQELAGIIEGTPRVWSSVAIRAQQTAVLAMAAFEEARGMARREVDIDPQVGLHEIFAGDFEMSGAPQAHRAYQAALRRWVAGEADAAMPGGESLQELLARYRPVLERGAENADRDLVIFSHGAAIRSVTANACGVDPDFAFENSITNCRFTVFEPRGEFGHWPLVRWGDSAQA